MFRQPQLAASADQQSQRNSSSEIYTWDQVVWDMKINCNIWNFSYQPLMISMMASGILNHRSERGLMLAKERSSQNIITMVVSSVYWTHQQLYVCSQSSCKASWHRSMMSDLEGYKAWQLISHCNDFLDSVVLDIHLKSMLAWRVKCTTQSISEAGSMQINASNKPERSSKDIPPYIDVASEEAKWAFSCRDVSQTLR